MTEIVKASRAAGVVKKLLNENKKLLAIESIILIYDTNTIDAKNFVEKLENHNEE